MPSTMRRTNGDNQLCTSSKRGRKARSIIEHPDPRFFKEWVDPRFARRWFCISGASPKATISFTDPSSGRGAAGSRYAATVERGLPYAPKRRGFIRSRSRRHVDPGDVHIPDRRHEPARLQPPEQRRSCGMRRCSRPIMFGAVVVTGRADGNDSRPYVYRCGNPQRSVRLDARELKMRLPSPRLRLRRSPFAPFCSPRSD